MLNRRGFLLRSAVVGAGTVVPIVAVAVQSEDAELLALGRTLDAAVVRCRVAIDAQDAAQQRFAELRPVLPRQKMCKLPYTAHLWVHGDWRDGYGGPLLDGVIAIRYVRPHAIRRVLKGMDGRTSAARKLKGMLPLVENYELDEETAISAAGLNERADDLYEERRNLATIGDVIFEQEAKTVEGLLVMARAIGSASLLEGENRFASLRWGPKLAENALAVLQREARP